MATEILVPTLGESVSEATVAQWLKKPGEAVAADEPVVELETDKVTLEVGAPQAPPRAASIASKSYAEKRSCAHFDEMLGVDETHTAQRQVRNEGVDEIAARLEERGVPTAGDNLGPLVQVRGEAFDDGPAAPPY